MNMTVMQVEVPKTGGRIMLASDGCWDAFDKTSRVAKAARNWPADVSPFPLSGPTSPWNGKQLETRCKKIA